MATGASSLPAHSFATGSAVVNMLRQIGLALGVAVLIAMLGSPQSPIAVLHVYQRATWTIAIIALAGGLVGLALLAPRPRHATSAAAAVARKALRNRCWTSRTARTIPVGWPNGLNSITRWRCCPRPS